MRSPLSDSPAQSPLGPGLLAVLLASLPAAAQSPIYELPAAAAGERQGAAVAFGGDRDGDGVPDLVVGAPGAQGGLGVARVLSGDTGMLLALYVGGTPGGEFGAALALADINADGRADLLVGAPQGGPGARGTVSVFDGWSGAPLFTLQGDAPADHFGWSLLALDDVSGDGLADFAVGAIDDDDLGASCGSVRVCSGYDGATLYTLTGTAGGELFGWSLCALPDLDGDGVRDFAIGAPHVVSASSTAPGYVRAVSGAGGATLATYAGKAGGDAFGRALALVGDLDGDGAGDLAVGAPQPTGGLQGYVQVRSSAGGGVLLSAAGQGASDLFGASVASAGDVDGDGTGDLAVGAPRANVLASDEGRVAILSGAHAGALLEFGGASSAAHLGAALAGGADVNGDGVVDLLIGADGAPGGGLAQVRSTRELLLTASAHGLSLAAGAGLDLRLEAGAAHAGRKYLMLGSLSGTQPGTVLAGLGLPLNPDRYFALTLKQSAGDLLGAQGGTLDAGGSALATFRPPQGAPAGLLLGLTFRHAYVVYDAAGTGLLASHAVPVTLLP